MKIGITTYFNIKNYGSALQAFAMRHFLMQNGHNAVFLSIKEQHPLDNLLHKLHVAFVTVIKCALNKEARKTQREINNLKQTSTSVITTEVKELFSRFEEKFLPSINIGRRALKRRAHSEEFGAFICGSDQIWSPLSVHLSGFKFLNFAPKSKRIAYAPSFGVSKIPSYNKKFVKKKIADIDDISVREFEGAQIVKQLINKDVPVLLDPTMLLTGAQWRKIYRENVSSSQSEQYVLCYFFDEPSLEIVSKIIEFAHFKKLKIKVLSSSNKTFIANGAEFVNAGPMEFMELADNAQYVFTNSFHGCVFSVLFNKKFIAFGRNHSEAVKQTSRIETLLKRIGAQESFYKSDLDDFVFTDTESFDRIIEPLRLASSEYLINCLKKRSV
ncbi:MAG: polysaccharide pyruvyl transferase family protein [Clostridia bacterium]|nr:polysaccharide pyruvyl transferase family protein [Clostridia bacterium]